MLSLVSSPLTPHAEPAIQEQWEGTLILGSSSLAGTTRAATPAKEQQDQLSKSVTSLILSSIPSASLWSMVLLSFCDALMEKELIPRNQGKASGGPHGTGVWVPVSPGIAQDL